jgi:hypothetical protein
MLPGLVRSTVVQVTLPLHDGVELELNLNIISSLPVPLLQYTPKSISNVELGQANNEHVIQT